MQRRHLFELTDLPGTPWVVRQLVVDYLRAVLRLMKPFDWLADDLSVLMKGAGTNRIVDLCAGAGGPWDTLLPLLDSRLGEPAEVLLTDLHPGTAGAQLPARVAAHPESVNACAVPAELVGIRTIFDGFHHLRPEVGEAVLKDAVDQGVPIGVFEVVERNVLAMLGMVLLVPVAVWILTPFVRPFTWWRLLLTYIVPVAPAAVTFDGVVSCMRVYEVPELEAMSARADPERAFEWRTWEQKDGLMTVTALIGRPAVSTP